MIWTYWVTLLITYSVAVCFNMLQYLHYYCLLTNPPATSIKWKPSLTLTPRHINKYINTKYIHYRIKHWVPVIRKKTPLLNRKRYFQGPKCGSRLDLGWHLSSKKILRDHFLDEWLDLHFIGAALLKADSLTVLITCSVTVFNLHYHCPLTLPPPTPVKWKPSRTLTTTSKRLSTIAKHSESQWSGEK